MKTCENCNGQGYFTEYYGARSNFYGSPDERKIRCEDCDGTGQTEETEFREPLSNEEWEACLRCSKKYMQEIREQINGLSDYDARAKSEGVIIL